MAKVTGGMKKDWISEVRRSSAVKRLVSEKGKLALDQAETSMQLEGAVQGRGFDYYYGSAEQDGRQGRTLTFWATNEVSMNDADSAFEAARSVGLIDAKEARSKR